MFDEAFTCPWNLLPDSLLLDIFAYIEVADLLRVGQVCNSWNRVANDEFLWKSLFLRDWKVPRSAQRAPGKASWQLEYKRLKYHTPLVETEVLTEHTNQVLHVCFSHNGQMFATSSKDGFIKVWNADYPATVRYSANLKEYGWKYTQYSQFNETDTLLLVSGVHSGLHSTTGEIFVFSIDEEFTLQSKVLNKPYDIFGTWYNDTYLLSGHLNWLGHMVSSSVLWLNCAFQETDDAYKAVVAKLYRFYNRNASSIRTIMVSKCLAKEEDTEPSGSAESNDYSMVRQMESVSNVRGNPLSHNMFVSSSERPTTSGDARLQRSSLTQGSTHSASGLVSLRQNHHDSLLGGGAEEKAPLLGPSSSSDPSIRRPRPQHQRVRKDTDPFDGSLILLEDSWKDEELNSDSDDEAPLNLALGAELDSCSSSYQPPPVHPLNPSTAGATNINPIIPPRVEVGDEEGIILDTEEKFLIFTTGSKTYTPHQVGFKRIRPFRFKDKISMSLVEKLAEQRENMLARSSPNFREEANMENMFDKVDHLIDLHGHIIGMALSPDHRFLYVNNRPWPKQYVIDNPLRPPQIAQEIDIHVIDLVTLKEVGTMLRSHKAYTPNDECFFIFLDVCGEYVASGAEDKHGYLWDRHYGICLAKYPHSDVVNSVAFNPSDSEMLITASDDYTLKIWRSKSRVKEIRDRSEISAALP